MRCSILTAMKLALPIFLAQWTLAAPANLVDRTLGTSTHYTLYLLLNEPSGNKIVPLNVDTSASPMFTIPKLITPTGGYASFGLDGNNNPVGADVLFSAGAIITGNNEYVFNINSGSNTLSMFKINSTDPTNLTMLGKPLNTLGDFPNSVDYSPALKLACVANSGSTNGISCFNVDPVNGLSHNTTLMNAGIFVQQTPPVGPGLTYSQVLWAPDSSILVAVNKGDDFTYGNITAIPFDSSTGTFGKPVVSATTFVQFPFGFSFLNNTEIFIADPHYGGLLYEFKPDHTYSVVQITNTTTDILTCWTAYSSSLQKMYAMDGGQNTIFQFNRDGTLSTNFDNGGPKTNPGSFDAVISDNEYLFTLTGQPGIATVDLPTLTAQPWFNTSSVSSDRQYYQGLAIFPDAGQPNFPNNYVKTAR